MALKLNLRTSSIPVTLEGEGGKSEEYQLCEMVAADRDKHLDSLADRIRLSPDGKPAGVKKFDGMQAELISRCLFKDGKPVPKETIQSWPASVVGALFDEAQKLNHLNATAEEVMGAAKNG